MSDHEKTAFRIPLRVSLLAILVMIGASVALWLLAPDNARIPMHWGIDGQPDRFGGKLEAALTLPGIAIVINAILGFAPHFEPRRRHLLQSAKAYRAIWIGVALLLAVIHVGIVALALGARFNHVSLGAGLIGVLFVVMGNYLGKTRSNFVMGIRTPWTLSSDRVWDRTHRLGGRLFMLVGAVALLLATLGMDMYAFPALLIGALAVAAISVVYSYLLWRGEQKDSPSGP